MKIFKKLEKKTRKEQFFAIIMMMLVVMGSVCVTGCGGGNDKKEDTQLFESHYDDEGNGGCLWTVPGCAGCLNCESGCLSCLWAQDCRCGKVSGKTGASEETSVYGCAIDYKGGGCFGCGKESKNTYIALSNNSDIGCISCGGVFSCLGFDGISCGKMNGF